MSPRKTRKALDESLASEFVYGASQETSQPVDEAEVDVIEVASETVEMKESSDRPSTKTDLMSKLMQMAEKEPTVRLTVDLPESMHRSLSILCARTGKKKAEIVRMLLDDVLKKLND